MIQLKKSFFVLLLSVAALLLVPFTAMQLTKEVNWSGLDFLSMAILLFLVGSLTLIAHRFIKKSIGRWVVSVAILIAFLLLWAEMAVGLIGSPIAGS